MFSSIKSFAIKSTLVLAVGGVVFAIAITTGLVVVTVAAVVLGCIVVGQSVNS